MSTTYRVHVLTNDRTGEIDVHGEGCADVTRAPQYWTSRAMGYAVAVVEVEDLRGVVEDTYGPEAGSFYAEAGIEEEDYAEAWRGFLSNFIVKPCAKHLPIDAR